MNAIGVKRKKTALPEGKAPLEEAVRQNTAWAEGTEFFQHRDPLYHVTESFQQNFDAMGRRHTVERAGAEPEEAGREGAGSEEAGRGERAGEPAAREDRDIPDPESSRSFYEMKDPEDQGMLRRFPETAFQRGTMSGTVIRGTGRMMLFSCLKKTIGQSQPVKEQQKKLFDHASQLRNVPGHTPDQVVFNRSFVDSAVGVVVDTLRDARRTVEDMQDLVGGRLSGTEEGLHGAETLWKMYPFLDDRRERELLDTYYAKLRDDSGMGPDERGILHNAVDRTRALVDKKARMRTEFINKLRFLSDRASEALTEFEEPGFTGALAEALEEAFGAEPPEDGGPNGGRPPERGPEAEEQDGTAQPEPVPPSGEADSRAGPGETGTSGE